MWLRGAAYQYLILSTAEITCANSDNGLQQAELWSEAMTNMYGAFELQDSANERFELLQTQMSTDINSFACLETDATTDTVLPIKALEDVPRKRIGERIGM